MDNTKKLSSANFRAPNEFQIRLRALAEVFYFLGLPEESLSVNTSIYVLSLDSINEIGMVSWLIRDELSFHLLSPIGDI